MSRHHRKLDRRRWEAVRLVVLDRDGWRCAKCGNYGNIADHIQRLADGGAPLDPRNIECLCRDCHKKKTTAENSREDPLALERAAWEQFARELFS